METGSRIVITNGRFKDREGIVLHSENIESPSKSGLYHLVILYNDDNLKLPVLVRDDDTKNLKEIDMTTLNEKVQQNYHYRPPVRSHILN